MTETDSIKPTEIANTISPQASVQRSDLEPMLVYLQTIQGHEIASRLIAVIEGIKHSTIDKSTANARIEKYVQLAVILAVVVSTSLLVATGKFEASVGVLFGTLVGYVFGKK